MISDSAKRDIQTMAAQLSNAVTQRMEAEQGPAQMYQAQFAERKQTRRFIVIEMMKALRMRPDVAATSIPGDESATTSEMLAAVAFADADHLMKGLEAREEFDRVQTEKAIEAFNKANHSGPSNIVPAPATALPRHQGRG